MKKHKQLNVKKIFVMLLIAALNMVAGMAFGQSAVPMASYTSTPYPQSFNSISLWSNNFSGTQVGESFWHGLAVATGSGIPNPVVITQNATSGTTVFQTSSSGGVQRGIQKLVLLATGTTDNSASTAVDFYMNFTGVNAGTITFNADTAANGTGDRKSTLYIYWSTDGTTWTQLTGTNLPYTATNNVSSPAVVTATLPSAFNGSATARLRFYVCNGTGGTTGSRAKISIDNLSVTATSTGGCTTAPTGVSISYSATTTIAGSVCEGATLSLTGNATNATSYSWSGPVALAGSTLQSPTPFTFGTVAAGTYTFTATNACGSTTVTRTFSSTYAPRNVIITSSATSLCAGAVLTLTSTTDFPSGPIPSYTWNGPGFYTNNNQNPPGITVSTTSAGIYSLSATNACGTGTATSTPITVNTTPTSVTATPSSTALCIGNTLTLTGAATGASSYSWSGPDGFSSTLLSPAAFTVGTASAGIYTLSATSSCGTTTATTTAITVGNGPAAVTATPSSATVCLGNTLTLTGTATGGTSYLWSGPGGFTSTLLNPASFTAGTVAAGVYTLAATNSCGTVTVTTTPVVVSNPPSAPSFTGTATIAYGNSTTLTLTGGANDIVYYWNGTTTANTTLSAGGTGSFTVAPSATTTYSVTSVTSSAGCTLASVTGVTVTITVTGSPADTIPTMDDNMAMGNPSSATTSTGNPNNYLLVKPQYALSYNNSKGEANWVSWHLSTAWKGSALRCDCFTQDGTLPSGYYQASTGDYTGSGFDRGHMCPSDDRDLSDADNAATFKMTNIAPQAPNLNQVTWESLESYCRALIYAGNELYIISGGYGSGGTGSAGSSSTIASGAINVPSRYFKVIVVLPVGTNDVNRVTTSTRVIAVDMPNAQTVSSQPWGYYRTSVDAIEAVTGYDFLSNVPTPIQDVIEAGIDNGPSNVLAWDFTGTGGDATFAATAVNSSLDASAGYNTLTRGSGAAASTGANSFRTQGFQNNGISTANTDYFQVKMKPVTGKKLSLSTIDATCTGTTSFAAAPGVSSQFAYSFDGTTYTLIGSPVVTTGSPANLPTVNVSSISALQNIPSSSTLYIRYYASGQTSTGGWGFYSQYTGNYGLAFDGSFSDEPCTTAPTSVTATISATTVCSGANVSLTGTATSIGATTYSWNGPGGYTSTDATPAAFTVNTASAGIYTLTATNACGSTSVTTTALTVNTTPTAVSATPSATSVCSGNTLTLTGAATGADSYSWSGPNSFSSTDLTPSAFTTGTANAGVYTLAATNSCGTTTTTTTAIAVVTMPTVAAISGSTSVAAGSTITLTNATPAGTWTSGTTSVATVTSGGTVTGVSSGSSVITYTVTNICGSATATLSVTVTTPVTTIAAWDCTGASNVATLAATVYNANLSTASSASNLTRGAGAAASAGSNSFRTVGFKNDGIATSNTDYFQATMTANTGYTLSVATIDARVNGTSSFASTSPNASSQFAYSTDGTNFTLIGSPQVVTSVPATLSQINVSSISALQNIPAGTTVYIRFYASGGTTTGGWGFYSPASGAYGLAFGGTISAAASCTTAPTAVTATPSATTLCAGNTLTLTGTATGAATYSWSGPNSFASTALNPAAVTVNTASAGIYTLTATNACGSTTVTTASVAVNTAPAAVTATPSATTLCPASTLTLSGTATGAGSYSWSGPNSFSSTDLNPAAFTVGTLSSGIYSLTATNSCGSTTATTTAVNVTNGPTTVTATASAATICNGNTLTLSGTATGADSYSWSGPNSFASTDLAPAGFTATTASAGIYTLTATNSCGSTTATTTAVTVNDVPAAVTANTSTATICAGNILTLTGTATGATAYSWSGPNSFSATDLNPASFTVNTAAAGVYTLTATNSCGSATATTTAVTVNPLPAPTITGTTTIITGATASLTFTGANGDVITYSWTGGGSASTTIGVSGTSIVTVSPSSTTTYSINNATSAAGCATAITGQSATVTIDAGCTAAPTGVSATLSSPALCAGNTLTLTGIATNGVSYSWSGPDGYSSTVLNPAAFTVNTASAGIYTLTATNACGSTSVTTTALTVNTTPTAVSATPSATSVCSGNTLTLTGAATGADSYSWSGPAGYSSTDLSPASFTAGTANAGVYTLAATNSCGTTTTTTSVAVISSPTVAAISGSSSVAVGSIITLTDATAGGTWVSGTTSVATVNSGGGVRGMAAGGVLISYTATNSCGSTTVTKAITVTASAVAMTINWNPVSNGQTAPSPWVPETISAAVTSPSGGMVRGSSFGAGAASGCYGGAGGWTSGGGTSASDANSCYFTITSSCNTMSLSTIQGYTRRSGSGPTTCNVWYAIGSATTYTLIGTWSVTATSGTTGTANSSSLSGISALQNIPAGTVVKFIFTPNGSSGNFYFTNSTLGVTGTTTAIPAPFAGVSPVNSTVLTGGNTSFGVSSVTNNTAYQWQRNTAGVSGGTWTNITSASLDGGSIYSGYSTSTTASSNTLTLTGVTSAINGYGYRVAMTNCAGTTYSAPAQLIVTSPVACSGTPSAGTVTPSTGSFCTSGSALLSTSGATSASGLSYQWQSSADSTSWADISGATNITYTSPTITLSTYYRLGITCSASSTTSYSNGALITINYLPPAGTISGTPAICFPGTTTLSETATGGTWSSGTTSVATINSTGVVTGVATGRSVITYTTTNGCGSRYDTVSVVVSNSPTAITVTPTTASMCPSSPAMYLTAGGSLTSYALAFLNSSTYSFSSGAQATSPITVSGIPSGATITGVTVILNGSTTTWTQDMVFNLKAPNGVILNLANARGGSSTAGYVNTTISSSGTAALGLSSAPFTGTFAADMATTGNIGPSGSIPSATSWTSLYSVPNGTWSLLGYWNYTSGSGNITGWKINISYTIPATYTWSPTAGLYTDSAATTAYTGTTANTVYALPSATSTYVVTASNGVCTNSSSVTVNVDTALVVAPVSGTDTFCVNDTATLHSATLGGTWSASNSNVAINAATGKLTALASGEAIITYSSTSGACSGFTRFPVHVNALPVVAPVTGGGALCTGSSLTLSDLTPGGIWSSGSATVATVNTSGVVTPVAQGLTTITYTYSDGTCSNFTTDTVHVYNMPSAITISPASLTICEGTTRSLTATGGVSGGTITLTNSTSYGFASGVQAIAPITVSGIPSGATITGVSVMINGSTTTWTQDMVFNLQAPNGTILNLANARGSSSSAGYVNTVISSTGTTTLTTAPFTGTFKADFNNTAAGLTGYIPTATSWSNLYSVPNGTWNLIGYWNYTSGSGVLNNWRLNITYTVPSTYTWSPSAGLFTNSAGTTPYSGTSLATVYASPSDTTTYVITSANGGCISTASATVNVNPAPVASISGTSVVCPGSSATITFTGDAYDTVFYNVNGGATRKLQLDNTGVSTFNVTPAADSAYNLTSVKSIAGCITTLTGQNATLTPSNPAISIGSVPEVCQSAGSISVPYLVSSGSPATYSITWSTAAIAAGYTNVINAPLTGGYISIAIPPTGTPGTYTGVITPSGAVCSGTGTTITSTFYAVPAATVVSAENPCANHTTAIQVNGIPGETVSYMVDSGSVIYGTVAGDSTLVISTGIITMPHNYTVINASNPVCATHIDTVVSIMPIPMQWIGGAAGHETDWNTAANWSCGFVPTSSDSVTILSSLYPPVMPGSVSATVGDLVVASGTVINLNTDAALNVTGDINNSGTVSGNGRVIMIGSAAQKISGIGTISNLELNNANGATIQPAARAMISSTLYLTVGTLTTNDSLELLSTDTAATARIAEIPAAGASVSGRVKTDQYVQGGYRRFRFWGHSFSETISLSQLTPYIDITGPGGSTNGFTTTASNNPSAFRYDPSIGNDTSSYSSGWIPFTRINALAADSNKLHPGQGIRLFFRGSKGEGLGYLGAYGMYTPSSTINKMIGHVNQGAVSIPLKRGTDIQTYNQISNPYPSPVDIGTVLYNAKAAGQITGSAFYVWNPSIGAGGQYMAIPIGTSAAEPYYIQANTSFQVRADHDGAHVDFTEADKVATASLNLFRAPAQAVRFNIYDTSYHLWDVLSLQFNDKASDNEDKQLDATKPYGPDMNFYSIAADGRKLAIDARPYEGDKAIPLGVKSAYQQDFVIRAESISVPTGGAVTLHDKLLNKYVDMKEGTEYRFTIGKDKATQGDDRFELVLKPTTAVAVKGLEVSMAPNPASDDVKITFTSGSKDNVSVRIMDVSGVSIYNQDLGTKQNGVITVPMSNFAAGVYMVELTQGEQKVTKRLVKE